MSRPSNILLRAINYDHTLVLAIELSNKSWVLAAQVPGFPQTKAQRTIEPNKNALLAAIDGYRARAAAVGYAVERVITTYDSWMVRVLAGEVARGARRRGPCRPAFERTRGSVHAPSEIGWHRCRAAPAHFACLASWRTDEDARRSVRERTELLSDRVGLTNRIGAVLATLGVTTTHWTAAMR